MRLLLSGIALLGAGAAGFCFYYALLDWAALQKAYGLYTRDIASGAGERELFIAHARQNIHRINLFADVVWSLLCAIPGAIGLHGLVVLKAGNSRG